MGGRIAIIVVSMQTLVDVTLCRINHWGAALTLGLVIVYLAVPQPAPVCIVCQEVHDFEAEL